MQSLEKHFEKYSEALGLSNFPNLKLKFINQSRVGNKIYVRFQQFIGRKILVNYQIPLRGATLTVTVTSRKLTRVNANLMLPPSFSLVFKNPGLQFAFTDKELARFISFFKTNEVASQSFRNYLNAIAANTQAANWSYDLFMNRQVVEQRKMLNDIFGRLSLFETAKLFYSAAAKEQLAFVRYGNIWMIEVTGFMDQPMQFDVEVPTSADKKMTIKNLRLRYHRIAQVRLSTVRIFLTRMESKMAPTPSGLAIR